MMPGKVLSSQALQGTFLAPRNIERQPFSSDSLGGIAIGDASAGLRSKIWHGVYSEEDNTFTLSAPSVSPTVVLTVPEVAAFDFTFDQNMRVFIAYTLLDGTSKFYWYDGLTSMFTTTTLPANCTDLRCVLDDPRPLQLTSGDIILAYLRAGSLYFRAQRERYLVEYELADGLEGKILGRFGMNNVNRLQFEVLG